ncbi:AAA family ATPase, partial [Vibrio parahaemolyticus]
MKITKLIAKNYRAFKSLEVSLTQVNLVIGKNGSGKSSIARLIPLI